MKKYIISYGHFKTDVKANNKNEAITYFKKHFPSARYFFPFRLFINAENQPNNKQQFYFEDEKI